VTAGLRVLVAGVGNVLCGDDGFGVEVARRLAARPALAGVTVMAFGVRSVDLTFALLDGCDAAIVVDATRRGGAPGSLYVLEPAVPEGRGLDLALALSPDHGLDATKVLAYVRAVGGKLASLRVVGCEPLNAMRPEDDGLAIGLSAPVAAAVEPACDLVERLARAAARGPADA
jgi:hydrogenase maturation protease